MEKPGIILYVLVLCLAFSACKETEKPLGEGDWIEFAFTFANDEEGWQGGFSDLRADDHDIFQLDYGHTALPEETGVQDNALYIQGHNQSDDLFMFFKKEINGLKPNAMYGVVIVIDLASQYPESSVGIGGSPGASVFLKVGAVNYEPQPEVIDDYLQMNIDKGNQAEEGKDMFIVGTVGIPGEVFQYKLIHMMGNQYRQLYVRASDTGSLWAIVGTDSGFEGLTRLYYDSIHITLEEIL